MRAWRRLFVLSAVLAGARDLAAQTPGPGGIVIIGVDLSGQWDLDMTVLNASDPAMIGRTFTGSFTVSGGVPEYSGEGTFNDLPATISGNGAVDPADGTTIILSDHIATDDSTTTFTATLMSGDFATGVFTGGTTDGTQTWSGVFKIAITRPPTQTPREQLMNYDEVASRTLSDVAIVAEAGMLDVATSALEQIGNAASRKDKQAIRTNALRSMLDIRSSAFRLIEENSRLARTEISDRLDAAPNEERESLRRLAGSLRAVLGEASSGAKTAIDRALRDGRMLMQDRPPKPPELERKKRCSIKVKIRSVLAKTDNWRKLDQNGDPVGTLSVQTWWTVTSDGEQVQVQPNV
ncbi:MAG: hypothetical protein HYY93_01115 [Planctomycetes bacterium]|nr:hypothetical protein [Planctomycetota bacterium]